MSWTIEGEAGKSLDETRRVISEVAQNPILRTVALGVDTLSFSQRFKRPDMSDLIAPEAGQKVTVLQDGVKQFTGVVLERPIEISADGGTVEIQAVGPWWDLEQTPLSSIATDQTGASSERAIFSLELGTVQAGITAILNRAIEVGVPVSIGTISDCYEIPAINFTGRSFADALAELVRWVPDAMAWWDYSGAGDPAFMLTRRGDAVDIEFPVGQHPLESASLAPMVRLETEEVVVESAIIGSDGLAAYASQSAGVPNRRKRQVVMVSGPEIGSPLEALGVPQEVVTGNQFRLYQIGAFECKLVLQHAWKEFRDSMENTATSILSVPVIRGSQNAVDWDYAKAPTYYNAAGDKITPVAASNAITTIDDEIPSWVAPLAEDGEVGTCRGTFQTVFSAPAGGGFDAFESEMIGLSDYYFSTDLGATIEVTAFFNLDIPLLFLTGPDSGSTISEVSYTKPLDVQFAQPPADLAANLQAAQSFLPYKGQVTLRSRTHLSLYQGRALNITGGPTEWRTARALIQGTEIDLASLRQTINLGVPQRLSLTDRLSRVRRDPSANTVRV